MTPDEFDSWIDYASDLWTYWKPKDAQVGALWVMFGDFPKEAAERVLMTHWTEGGQNKRQPDWNAVRDKLKGMRLLFDDGEFRWNGVDEGAANHWKRMCAMRGLSAEWDDFVRWCKANGKSRAPTQVERDGARKHLKLILGIRSDEQERDYLEREDKYYEVRGRMHAEACIAREARIAKRAKGTTAGSDSMEVAVDGQTDDELATF